jgi:YjbE family integral membrane protein
MLEHFLLSGFSIIIIDLLLAGDNALVIAMAVRSLSKDERRKGILLGSAVAVVLRVLLTFVAARLLTLPFLQLAGGALVLWIAFRVLVDASEAPENTPAPRRLMEVIWFITAADLTMSVDNILAVAGASHGSIELIVFGLALSIPLVIFSSNLLSNLMDKYPIVVYVGVAILAKVAGDMMVSDPFILDRLHPPPLAHYVLDAALIAVVIVVGLRIRSRRKKAAGQE